MKLTNRAPRGAVVTLVALIAALGVAACGSSSNNSSKNASVTTTTKSGSGKSTSQTALTTCLKQHGVTLPKRRPGAGFGGGTGTNTAPPTGTTAHGGPGSGGIFGGGGAPGGGFASGNSKFAKAFEACRSKLGSGAGSFGGGFGRSGFRGGARGGPVHAQFSTAALKSFAACVRKNGYKAMPEPNTSGKGAVLPSSVEKNAKFQAASRKCVSILQSGIHARGQSTTSTSSSTASA
jgi:hypothetical protein